MRVAMAVNRIADDIQWNLAVIERYVHEAAVGGARLLLLPEMAVTGFVADGNPTHDLPLGSMVPGEITDRLVDAAGNAGIWLAIGLLERAGDRLFDSAILISPAGQIVLKYRRIHPGWRARKADPCVYREGTEMLTADTELGRIAFVICGDLFDDGIAARTRATRPDVVLFPIARCFENGEWDDERWRRDERPGYLARMAQLGSPCLMVNSLSVAPLAGGCFGGAMAVGRDGAVLGERVLGEDGLLVIDVPDVRGS
jgi:predicted amidohydrolase